MRVAVPPIELYDGPAWRTLRAYLARHTDEHLTVLALSASYGIVHARRNLSERDRIAPYNQRMTMAQASDLSWVEPLVIRTLESERAIMDVRADRFPLQFITPIAIVGGAAYRLALAGVTWRPTDDVFTASGGIGTQLGQLKRWLHDEPLPRALPR